MIDKKKFLAGKKPAQAMVEFAIALPVLLLLLYGILEAGRLLFLYSTVVTASRQAARYGSATGEGNNGVPRYQDCQGMRAAANAVGYLGQFDTISFQYDTGPGTGPSPLCADPNNPTDSSFNTEKLTGNRTRIIVTVQQHFKPLVRLVPFFDRNISATSARTVLYSVPIVVEQDEKEWFKIPTILLITGDTPDPSEINQSVLVTVSLVDDNNDPVAGATVEIGGADVNCPITTDGSGTGSCSVIFSTPGPKVLTAFYSGDADYLGSSDTEDHTVTLIQTTTTILSHLPDPSLPDQQFVIFVQVAGSQTPTGTVEVNGGQGERCTITLTNGTGNCPMSYKNSGVKTLTATYQPNNAIFDPGLPATATHTVIDFTPTPTHTATATLAPTITPIPATPTLTLTPTITPTIVPGCNQVSHGSISLSGNIMSMTISNPYPFPIVLRDVTVTWNDDKGHQTSSDKTLNLLQVAVGGAVVWTGNESNASTKTIPTTAIIPAYPPGTTTIDFSFHQTYDNLDGTEKIYINLLTPGCENNPIDSGK